MRCRLLREISHDVPRIIRWGTWERLLYERYSPRVYPFMGAGSRELRDDYDFSASASVIIRRRGDRWSRGNSSLPFLGESGSLHAFSSIARCLGSVEVFTLMLS